MSSVGPQSSRMCDDIVAEFFQCRKDKGLSGMTAGLCGELLRNMNRCLDEETAIRRKENGIEAKKRREKYMALIDQQREGEERERDESGWVL